MTFDGLILLAWNAGLAFLTLCWWTACQIHNAETIPADHPEAFTGLDQLETHGAASYTERRRS